jgi:hypothetical protein
MAQAFVSTASEPWVGDRRPLWVFLADTPGLAVETARADGCRVDGIVGTLSEETVELLGIQSGRAMLLWWQKDHGASRLPGAPIRYLAATSWGTPNGQALPYIYSREDATEALQAKMLTMDEARRIAINVARLPELLGKAEHD